MDFRRNQIEIINGDGLWLNDNSGNNLLVAKNNILGNGSKVRNILISDTPNLIVLENTLNKATSTSTDRGAIQLQIASYSDFLTNTLTGQISTGSGSTSNAGILSDVGNVASIVDCNRINTFDFGFKAEWPESYIFSRNKFYGNDIGIDLIIGSINPQNNTLNQWVTPSVTADFSDVASGCDLFTIFTTSSPWWPTTTAGSPCLAVGGTAPSLQAMQCTYLAEDPGPQDPKDPERFAFTSPFQEELPGMYEINNSFYEETADYHTATIQLMQHLTKFPDLIESINAQEMYAAISETTLGLVADVEYWLKNELIFDPVQGLDNIFSIQKELMLALNENDSYLVAEKILELEESLPAVRSDQAELDAFTHNELSEKIAYLESLSSEETKTEYYRKVMLLKLKTRNKVQLSGEEVLFLGETSELCYNEYGIAVYLASSILNLVHNETDCGAQSKPNLQNNLVQNKLVKKDKITVIPTLASNEIVIKMDNQSSEERTLLFIDTTGKRYYAHKTTSAKTIVDVSTLPSQLYFVRVVDSAGHPLMVSKFVKID